MSFLRKNCCDGIYKSFDVHFTKHCDNRCAFCVDQGSVTLNQGRPDWQAIGQTIINNQEGMDDVLFLGGEPCLYLNELHSVLLMLKKETNLKLYVTSAMPKTCYDNFGRCASLLTTTTRDTVAAVDAVAAVDTVVNDS